MTVLDEVNEMKQQGLSEAQIAQKVKYSDFEISRRIYFAYLDGAITEEDLLKAVPNGPNETEIKRIIKNPTANREIIIADAKQKIDNALKRNDSIICL